MGVSVQPKLGLALGNDAAHVADEKPIPITFPWNCGATLRAVRQMMSQHHCLGCGFVRKFNKNSVALVHPNRRSLAMFSKSGQCFSYN